MQSSSQSLFKSASLPIEDYSILLSRYQRLSLAERAKALLNDADPALQTVEMILKQLAGDEKLPQALANIRGNASLINKLRPSEARDILMDSSSDFIHRARQKFAAWSHAMQRLSDGEGIATQNNREFIPHDSPLAVAIIGSACISNYLAMVQLILTELSKIDDTNVSRYDFIVVHTRRCSTVLSDYENASNIPTSVH